MAIEITMPKLSDTMQEGTIVAWHVQVGDQVERGQIIAEVETDKASMEMEAFDAGVVTSLAVAEGETVPVGTLLATMGGDAEQPVEVVSAPEPGEVPLPEEEPYQDEPSLFDIPTMKPAAPATSQPVTPVVPVESAADDQPAASPAARKLAEQMGIDLQTVHGSGPGGRIVLADVERALPKEEPAPALVEETPPEPEESLEPEASPEPAVTEIPAVVATEEHHPGSGKSVKIRRLIARKMEKAWQTIPHFYVTMAVDMTDIIRFRKDLEVTINDFVVAATARALEEHPWVNATWNGEQGIELPHINIAMAVATDRGLYNPVIHNCEKLSLRQISNKAKELAEKANKQGQLKQEEMEGGTFTVTNMGMLGVESFGAIITPPQAAVLSVGTVKGEIVVDDQGEPAVAPVMRLTLAADHRVLDGADAAEFLGTIKSYLEAPIILVSD